jgi:hypothetical protein
MYIEDMHIAQYLNSCVYSVYQIHTPCVSPDVECRWEDIASGQRGGTRLQVHYTGPRDHYVLGGIHMTHSNFLPNVFLKEITGTEYTREISGFYNNHFTLSDLDMQQAMVHALDTRPQWRNTTDPVDKVADVNKFLPWFLECNPDRCHSP